MKDREFEVIRNATLQRLRHDLMHADSWTSDDLAAVAALFRDCAGMVQNEAARRLRSELAAERKAA